MRDGYADLGAVLDARRWLVGVNKLHHHVELTFQRVPGQPGRWSAPQWWGPDEFGEWDTYTTLGDELS
jgi:hypothetical protein